MTALLILGIVCLILFVATAVLALHAVRQTSADAFRALERLDARHEKSLQTVLNRLMTIRWENFAAIQATDDGEEGGFITPSEQRGDEDDTDHSDLKQVFHLRGAPSVTPEEEMLLAEDFPDEVAR